jgi:hypothetical protein
MHRSPSPYSCRFILSFVCALVFLALAGTPALAAVGATEIGHFDVPLFAGGLNVGDLYSQAPHAPVLTGTSLFVPLGAYGDGLVSFDLADPTKPRFLSQFTGIKSRQLAPSGNLLYSVDGERLNVLDVTDPAAPVLRGTLELNGPGTAGSVAAHGTLAFVTGPGGFYGSGAPALFAVNVLSPDHPQVLGSVGPGGIDVLLSGNIAYVAALGDGLRLYDVSNPGAMTPLASIGTLGDAVKVRLAGTNAYVFNTAPAPSLTVVDVSDPVHPSVKGVVTVPFDAFYGDYFGGFGAGAYEMQISGRYAFLCGWRGLVVIDISDPTAPVVVGNIGAEVYTGGVAIHDDLLVLANQQGISVLRLGAAPVAAGGPDLDSKGNLILNGMPSSDADGSVVAWRWHLQNREASATSYDLAGSIVSLQNVVVGVYSVSLTVTDDVGTDSDPLLFPLAVPNARSNNGRAVGPPK